jgi:hypothetical protein
MHGPRLLFCAIPLVEHLTLPSTWRLPGASWPDPDAGVLFGARCRFRLHGACAGNAQRRDDRPAAIQATVTVVERAATKNCGKYGGRSGVLLERRQNHPRRNDPMPSSVDGSVSLRVSLRVSIGHSRRVNSVNNVNRRERPTGRRVRHSHRRSACRQDDDHTPLERAVARPSSWSSPRRLPLPHAAKGVAGGVMG